MTSSRKWWAWKIILSVFVVALVILTRPSCHLLFSYLSDQDTREAVPAGYADDASRLNLTKVDTILSLTRDSSEAIKQIRRMIAYAREKQQKISIAGARHTMGGHTMYPGGIVLDTRHLNWMNLDTADGTLTVGSGALWSEVIPYLDRSGRSVIVMQSNNSFSVGGSVSVNCHGWQPNSPPIASTVKSFRLIAADGSIVSCSRDQNKELFSLALGGYGLFGVILDVQMRTTPNACYAFESFVVPSEKYMDVFARQVTGNRKAAMAYGRLDIRPESFLNEAVLAVFTEDGGTPPPLTVPAFATLRREVFRGTVGSEYGKDLRWGMERSLGEFVSENKFSRNQLMNEEVDIYENRSAESTDILHEYFIPAKNVPAFIKKLREVIPAHRQDLLNVTLRNVCKDEDAFLHYAGEEVLGFVMFFNQKVDPASEKDTRDLTQELTNAAIQLGGSYYLPYRLHASRDQFVKAYPMAEEFFRLKKKYDPEEIFQNKFYVQYK